MLQQVRIGGISSPPLECLVPENHAATVARLAEYLDTAERITVLTGAGVSAASGVPTFRGSEGLWRTHRPEELAAAQAFELDPAWCGSGTTGDGNLWPRANRTVHMKCSRTGVTASPISHW